MAEVDQTNQAQQAEQAQQPQGQSVLDLIRVETLGQQAQITGVIAYETEVSSGGKFPLMFFPLIDTFVRVGDESEELPKNVLSISGTQQYSSTCLSVFVKSARNLGQPNFEVDFTVFRQASYSWPEHRVIDVNQFPNEKEAITELLRLIYERHATNEIAQNKAPVDVADQFFGIYYLPQSQMEETVSKSPTAKFINIPSLGEYAPAQPDAPAAGLPDDLLDLPPSRGQGLDQL